MKNLITCFILLLIFKTGVAQFPANRDKRMKTMFGRDLFVYQLYNIADRQDSTKSRLECYFDLVNDILTFYKIDNFYQAEFELAVIVYQDEELFAQKILRDTVRVQMYKETNSRIPPRRYSTFFSLDPDKYKVLIKLTDGQGNDLLEEEKDIKLEDFSGQELRVSDIIFAERADCNQNPPSLEPNLRDSFRDMNSDFMFFVNIAPPKRGDSLHLESTVTNSDGKKVMDVTGHYPLHGADRLIDLCISMKPYLNQAGEYQAVFRAHTENNKIVKRKQFSVLWGNVPGQQQNLDAAIEQLSVVANKKTIDSLRQAKGNEKKKLFDQFWERRDPTPDTELNQLKQEYYRRAEFANRNFSELKTGRIGWNTDRGHVYLKYGKPDDVKREQNSMSGPVIETWTYEKISRRYIFIDRENNGVFRLYRVD